MKQDTVHCLQNCGLYCIAFPGNITLHYFQNMHYLQAITEWVENVKPSFFLIYTLSSRLCATQT
jgi:Fe-S-cluster containining protein